MNLSESQTVYVYFWDSWRETPTRLYDLRLLLGVLVCMLLNCIWEDIIRLFSWEKSVYVYLWDSWRETPTRLYDLRLLLGVCMLLNCIWEDIIRLFSWEKSDSVCILLRQLERDTYQAVWSEAVVGSMHVVELYMRRHYQTFLLRKA